MKNTLADILADSDEADPRFIEQFFAAMLANASPANAKKIASHGLPLSSTPIVAAPELTAIPVLAGAQQ